MSNDPTATIGSVLAGTANLLADAASANQAPAPLGVLAQQAFANPKTDAPAGATTFAPSASGNLFAEQLATSIPQHELQQAMQLYAGQVIQMVESAYAGYGYPVNDLGVALGAFVETCWEIHEGTFKIGQGTDQDMAKTQTTVRQMQNALLTLPAFATLPDGDKQGLYDACTFQIGHLVTQWQQAGSDTNQKAILQQTANQQLQTLFGIDADTLTRRPDGAFVSTNAVAAPETAAPVDNMSPATITTTAPEPTVPTSSEALPAMSAQGAEIYVKYTFTGTTTRFDQLLLFPGGAAFSDIPGDPVAQFDEATLRAALKPFDIGTWAQSGDTLTLTFPGKNGPDVTTLHKVPRGWYDGEEIDPDDSYNTYFPVIPVTPEQIAGAWESQSLTTMGFAGGAAPLVAGGSSSTRTFHADGTFTGGKESFASATTANVGDAFKSGGDVGVYGANNRKEVGRWRLDGPLLSRDENGNRSVVLAFILPHWKNDGPPDLLIDGDWWKRPDA